MQKTSNQLPSTKWHYFNGLDSELVRIRRALPPNKRIQAMLDARELVVGLMRGRLRRRYPHLSLREINLKILEEIERVNSIRPRPEPIP